MTTELQAAAAEIAAREADKPLDKLTLKIGVEVPDLLETAFGDVVRGVLDHRQRKHFEWAQRVFGNLPGVDVMSPRVRALRFLEEAIELYQAVTAADGMDADAAESKAIDLLQYVYDRPVGDPGQEVGGVMVTLLSLCERLGLSMDECERREFARVNAVDVEKLRAKQLAKIAAGVEL